jgi:hypothetical protein
MPNQRGMNARNFLKDTGDSLTNVVLIRLRDRRHSSHAVVISSVSVAGVLKAPCIEIEGTSRFACRSGAKRVATQAPPPFWWACARTFNVIGGVERVANGGRLCGQVFFLYADDDF